MYTVDMDTGNLNNLTYLDILVINSTIVAFTCMFYLIMEIFKKK